MDRRSFLTTMAATTGSLMLQHLAFGQGLYRGATNFDSGTRNPAPSAPLPRNFYTRFPPTVVRGLCFPFPKGTNSNSNWLLVACRVDSVGPGGAPPSRPWRGLRHQWQSQAGTKGPSRRASFRRPRPVVPRAFIRVVQWLRVKKYGASRLGLIFPVSKRSPSRGLQMGSAHCPPNARPVPRSSPDRT